MVVRRGLEGWMEERMRKMDERVDERDKWKGG